MATSKIEWLMGGKTWNVVTGCSRVGAGCDHCYARAMARRLAKIRTVRHRERYEGFKVHCWPERLDEPLRWRDPCAVFISMGDPFHAGVPFEFIDRMMAVVALTPHLTHIWLTKRPGRALEYMQSRSRSSKYWEAACPAGYTFRYEGIPLLPFPLPNLWLGVSPWDQPSADEFIPLLLQTPAAKRIVSIEPMLGPVDLTRVRFPTGCVENVLDCGVSEWAQRCGIDKLNGIDWCILGAETGPGARPMALTWAADVRDQCVAAKVPFFFKKNSHGSRLLDGREWNEVPHA